MKLLKKILRIEQDIRVNEQNQPPTNYVDMSGVLFLSLVKNKTQKGTAKGSKDITVFKTFKILMGMNR